MLLNIKHALLVLRVLILNMPRLRIQVNVCLCVPPTGHDCSVRLWMLDNRTCVQEITAHRKKHDEAIHDVAFHASQPFIASAGADALAKIFV